MGNLGILKKKIKNIKNIFFQKVSYGFFLVKQFVKELSIQNFEIIIFQKKNFFLGHPSISILVFGLGIRVVLLVLISNIFSHDTYSRQYCIL